jgi:hypothetical protein
VHIWTDTPLGEIWNQLRYLSAPANVAGVLDGKITSGRSVAWNDDDDLRAKSYEIACCVKQADEYFMASRQTGLATRPLLQFYGVQSLAKAAVLANDKNLRLRDIRYHGLSTRPKAAQQADREALQLYTDSPGDWLLESEFAITNLGVFPHLARIAGDPEPSEGELVRFKELLAIIPDIAALYSRHYGEPSHCIYLYSGPEVGTTGRYEIFFSHLTAREILEVFPHFRDGYEEVTRDKHPGFRANSADTDISKVVKEQRGAVAGRYAVRPHRIGIYSSLPALYAASFILSNVVRYKPAFWMGVVEGGISGSAALAESLCNLVDRHFPNQILETIWHERFTYGGPAYLS